MLPQLFKNRQVAGERLAEKLIDLKNNESVILALPRGGVPIAAAIAEKLKLPFTVFVVRKIGAPDQPEFGVGALAEGGLIIFDQQSLALANLTAKDLEPIVQLENEELKRRVALYRANRPLPDIKNKTVILVDDGLATGITAMAAIRSLKLKQPQKIILAIPVCPVATLKKLQKEAGELLCLNSPQYFNAVGEWYEEFNQVSDEEVIEMLNT